MLKFDISKYFFNIDHEICKEILKTKIKDKDVLNIIDKIIDSTDLEYVNETIDKLNLKEISKTKDKNIIDSINKLPNYKKGKGLPIGNMSSQILAILYLNELDHYIKETLKVHYIRYMDDGILIHESKEYLKYCLEEITKIVNKYKLELNHKTKIYTSKEGFEFLGFRFIIKNKKVIMKVKNQTKKRFKKKIKKIYKLYYSNLIDYNKKVQIVNSYKGHLMHGNSSNLYKNVIENNTKKIIFNVYNVKILDNDLIYTKEQIIINL